jgi:hypothetical protein
VDGEEKKGTWRYDTKGRSDGSPQKRLNEATGKQRVSMKRKRRKRRRKKRLTFVMVLREEQR